jgi:hypothetical protein
MSTPAGPVGGSGRGTAGTAATAAGPPGSSGASSRRRVEAALAHVEADRAPLDLGGSPVTGIQASALYRLRQALGLDAPGTPVKIVEPFQMLGEVGPDLAEALGVDVAGVGLATNFFGFRNEDWKPWTLFDSTPVLVPGRFNTGAGPDGSVLMYPEGDTSVPPSARMPKGGFYFDALDRQEPVDDDNLDPHDNLEEFGPISTEGLAHIASEVDRLFPTGKALLGNFGGTSFGDVALVPAMNLKYVKGIRDVEEWYVSLNLRPGYIYEVFEHQCEIGLANLAKIHQAVGDKLTAVFVTGTDFGGQQAPLISPRTYRDLFKPFHVQVNDWVHSHTGWKSFIHSCGSIWLLLDEIVDAGFDILNPVQTSAGGMVPTDLKQKYGDRVAFWGGGIDTQRVLPFGTPDDVRAMVHERMRVFGKGGGFVFNTVHNVQAGVPTENLLALYKAVNDFRDYPLG